MAVAAATAAVVRGPIAAAATDKVDVAGKEVAGTTALLVFIIPPAANKDERTGACVAVRVALARLSVRSCPSWMAVAAASAAVVVVRPIAAAAMGKEVVAGRDAVGTTALLEFVIPPAAEEDGMTCVSVAIGTALVSLLATWAAAAAACVFFFIFERAFW